MKTMEQLQQEMTANFETQKALLFARGYKEKQSTIPIQEVYQKLLLTTIPLIIAMILLFFVRWRTFFLREYASLLSIILVLGLFYLSVPIHELLHGVAFHFFCEKSWKSVHFGVIKEPFTPYCHCSEPLSFAGYMTSILTPLTLLGIVPSIIGILMGNPLFLLFGGISIFSAGGDTTVALLLWRFRKTKSLYLDHPTECGFVAFTK